MTTAAFAEAPKIAAIEVTGNQRIAAETIRHELPLKPGDRYDAGKVNAALKALYASGQFADVRIDQTGSTLRVSVVEHPLIRRVSFTGQKDASEKDVKGAARLEPGTPFSRVSAEDAKERVRALYRTKGHADIAVDIQSVEQAGRVDLVVAVHEGANIKVAKVEFEGNRTFSAAALQDVIATRPAGLLDFLRSDAGYDEARLDLDRERLLRHYRTNGFADVAIAPAVSKRDPASGAWLITFKIDEGDRYRFGPVTISAGDTGVAAASLQRQIGMKAGDVWSLAAVDSSLEAMSEKLVGQGVTTVDIAPVPRRDAEKHEIALDFVLRPAPRVTIERIEITGNLRTKDVVIRRELRFAEGDLFHPVLLQKARKRLLALGLFKSVDFKTVPTKVKDKIVLILAVLEQDSAELGWGIGYSSSEGVIGDISYTERNLLGNGQYLKLKLAGSELRREAEISFTEPYFMGRPIAAGFDLFYRNNDLTQTSSYKSTKIGGDVRIGFEVADNTRSTVSYTLSRNTMSDVGPNASAAIKQAVPGYPDNTSSTYYSSAIGTSLAYDTRDKASNPMRGVYISTSQDLAGLGGDVRYLRSQAEARAYIPVGERTVLATRAVGGTITGWGGSDVRLLDMYYKGGETIRGFAPGGIGPRDVSSLNQDALGGTNFIATSAELRTPVPFLPSDFGLRAAVFADAGTLWGTTAAVKAVPGVVGTSAALRASTGVGLIWDSPVGALRVDYAQPLVKQPFDKTQPLRFGLVPF